jgi:hypothetical protein
MDDAFSCLRSLSLWRSLAAFPAGRALASAKPGPKVDRHIIADLEQHSTWKIRDFRDQHLFPTRPRLGAAAWNQTASDDGIFNQRVRLNEAWYYIILLLSGLVPKPAPTVRGSFPVIGFRKRGSFWYYPRLRLGGPPE